MFIKDSEIYSHPIATTAEAAAFVAGMYRLDKDERMRVKRIHMRGHTGVKVCPALDLKPIKDMFPNVEDVIIVNLRIVDVDVPFIMNAKFLTLINVGMIRFNMTPKSRCVSLDLSYNPQLEWVYFFENREPEFVCSKGCDILKNDFRASNYSRMTPVFISDEKKWSKPHIYLKCPMSPVDYNFNQMMLDAMTPITHVIDESKLSDFDLTTLRAVKILRKRRDRFIQFNSNTIYGNEFYEEMIKHIAKNEKLYPILDISYAEVFQLVWNRMHTEMRERLRKLETDGDAAAKDNSLLAMMSNMFKKSATSSETPAQHIYTTSMKRMHLKFQNAVMYGAYRNITLKVWRLLQFLADICPDIKAVFDMYYTAQTNKTTHVSANDSPIPTQTYTPRPYGPELPPVSEATNTVSVRLPFSVAQSSYYMPQVCTTDIRMNVL